MGQESNSKRKKYAEELQGLRLVLKRQTAQLEELNAEGVKEAATPV